MDTSRDALDIAGQNVELNQLDLSKAEFVRDDVFKLLRAYREHGEKFKRHHHGPPKFVENKSQLMGPAGAIKNVAHVSDSTAQSRAAPLLTFSCSGLMTSDLFQKIIADAAIDAGRDVQFIEQFKIGRRSPGDRHLPGRGCI